MTLERPGAVEPAASRAVLGVHELIRRLLPAPVILVSALVCLRAERRLAVAGAAALCIGGNFCLDFLARRAHAPRSSAILSGPARMALNSVASSLVAYAGGAEGLGWVAALPLLAALGHMPHVSAFLGNGCVMLGTVAAYGLAGAGAGDVLTAAGVLLATSVLATPVVNELRDFWSREFWFRDAGRAAAERGGLRVHASVAPAAGLVSADSASPPRFQGLRVLLVEDLRINQIVGRRLLEALGCAVELAAHGREALELLAYQHFDAVLMDCQMPELDGYDATRALRDREARAGQPRTPVVAVTAALRSANRDRCTAAGMDALIGKPLREVELHQALAQVLEGRAGAVPSGPIA